eukprot:5295921-Ditylum_brightwellii.AAC.1
MTKDTQVLQHTITTSQILGQMYMTCILARAPFCMLVGVAANAVILTDYKSYSWESPTAIAMEQNTK